MEGDENPLEERYKPLAKKRQNIGPAGVPQVRPLRTVERRSYQSFSANLFDVLYFASFLSTDY